MLLPDCLVDYNPSLLSTVQVKAFTQCSYSRVSRSDLLQSPVMNMQ